MRRPARARALQYRLDGRPDFRRVPKDRMARTIKEWYDAHPDKFRERWGEPGKGGRGR